MTALSKGARILRASRPPAVKNTDEMGYFLDIIAFFLPINVNQRKKKFKKDPKRPSRRFVFQIGLKTVFFNIKKV